MASPLPEKEKSPSIISAEPPAIAPLLKFLHRFYGWLGWNVAKYAKTTIFITTLLTVVFGGITATTE